MIEEKLYLSISHTAGMVAAAANERPIGIDVQASRPITPHFLLEYAECCEVPGMDGIELWSAIESVAKTGLTTIGKARRATRITKDNQVLVHGEHAGELDIIRFAHGAPDGTVLSLFRQY